MSPFDFDRLIDRRNTSSDKWTKYKGTDILPMWVADTDFQSPSCITEALHDRVNHGVFGYTRTPDSLNTVFIERMSHKYDWTLNASDLTWLPGLVCGLNLATRALAQPNDSVMTATPIYPPFMSAPKRSNNTLIKLSMKEGLIDLTSLESEIKPHTKLLLFCNPHNPGGGMYHRTQLEELADILIRHDLLICSDEIHCDLILDPDRYHTPIASLHPEIAARTITLMAPSKTWNIAGLACSVAIIQDQRLRERFQAISKGIVPDVNIMGYVAAEAAYRDGDDWNTAQCEYLRGNRDYLYREINSIPGLSMAQNAATYLAWIDANELPVPHPQRFFEAAGVGLSNGEDFGDKGFVRLNFGCPRSRLEEAVHRIERAVATL